VVYVVAILGLADFASAFFCGYRSSGISLQLLSAAFSPNLAFSAPATLMNGCPA
jgi:hypothetical protein